MSLSAEQWLKRIQLLKPLPLKIMNVCGGHERVITLSGLRSLLPTWLELIPGPGCPVCVCPEEDVYTAIQLATQKKVILVTFGDMLRVPISPKLSPRSLAQAHTLGADIRPIASPLDAVKIAQQHPQRQIVFFVAGFETTIAPIAALLMQGVPDNLSFLLSGRLTYPAVAMLLSNGAIGFDGLIAPGHVSTVMGAHEWEFVPKQHHIPAAIAGFTIESLLAAIYSIIRQQLAQSYFLDNCYPQVVQHAGNLTAQTYLNTTLRITDAVWRGIGIIPQSGFELRHPQFDARQRFTNYARLEHRRGDMPSGCACAEVILGRIKPSHCRLYGTACTPKQPIGPCMVSDEGACRIWWAGGIENSSS